MSLMDDEVFKQYLQEAARQVTEGLPPLTDEQNRGLTVVAARYAARKRREARGSAA